MRLYDRERVRVMENKLYWLWLTLKTEIKPKELSSLIEKNGGAGNIYAIEDSKELSGLSEDAIKGVMDKSLDDAKEVAAKVERMGGYIVTIEDECYPELLRSIYMPPYVLYMTGERLRWEELLTLTIVGTRRYDDYGRRITENIAKELAEKGATVVSGMARGIDSIAELEAIKSGGKTVAVLGSGLDVIYPPEHAQLYEMIKKNGVVMTEFPPGTRPNKENFPRRNRIMAGLSYGVIVTQAPEKSGALITAAHAIENGRDVYAVPADITRAASKGSNSLISQGAKAVFCGMDIINEYPYANLNKTETKPVYVEEKLNNINFDELDEVQSEIVKAIGNDSLHIDELSRKLKKESFELNSQLLMLEINGIVRKLNGNIYELS